jgi:hypothetical protein
MGYTSAMGLYMKQEQKRTQLQEELDERLRKRHEESQRLMDNPDGVEDSAYIEGTKRTTTLDWAWVLIVIFAIGVFGFFIYMVNS